MGPARDAVDGAIKVIASAMVAAIFLITLAQVVLRYVFSIALPWSAEAAQILLVYTVMLVAAYAAGRGSHFTVTAIVDLLPARVRPWLAIVQRLLVAAFALVAIVYGTRLAMGQMGSRLPALRMPVGMVYMALPIGAVITLFYALIGPRERAVASPGV